MRLTWNKVATTNFVADNITFSTDSSFTQAAARAETIGYSALIVRTGVLIRSMMPRAPTHSETSDDWPRNKLFFVEDEGWG